MANEDDDIPPLEDMTEAINSLKLRTRNKTTDIKTIKRNEWLDVNDDSEKVKSQRIEALLGTKKDKKTSVETKDSHNEKKDSTYCGFQKGFLLGEKKNIKKVIEVKQKEETNKNVIAEVQDARKHNIPLLQSNEWLTEDLLKKILLNPKLAKQFSDPKFNEAISLFQTNPQRVMAMCQKNPELCEFIQEFCALMGEHFTNYAELQEAKTIDEKTSVEQRQQQEDEKKMKAILSDPEVASILQNPDIQNLFQFLRSDPDKANRMIKNARGQLRAHIQKLVDVGLLQFAR